MSKELKKFEPGSKDLFKENIEKLKELFPQVVSDGEIDFEMLKTILDKNLTESVEKYQFTWNGKARTIKLAQTPSSGTLLPSKKDSKNWETTENLYIEGDNLEVLKLLQKTYFNKIKMIYIDPPYNTGGDFVYKDDFKDSIKNYKEQTNQTTRTNPETSGRYHTDWLNMMYSRLMLAKNLLSDDGVIFVSIDENEVENLKKIMNEIFGENNFIGEFIKQSKIGGGSDTKFIVKEHEYIIVFSKSIDNAPEMFEEFEIDYLKRYKEKDESGLFFWDTFARPGLKNPIFYNIETPDGSNLYNGWIRSKDRFENDKKNGEIRFIKKQNGSWSVQFKQYLNKNGKKPRSLSKEFGGNIEGKNELKELFNKVDIFDYPKSKNFLSKLLKILNYNNSIILDFFSGSATTAHAVMQLNAEDGGNRKFIMVQLPEKTQEDSEAYKAGYKNICEIGKERIRRAGELVKKDLIEKNSKLDKDEEKVDPNKLDIGFKVFKLDESNFKEWDSSKEPTVEQLELFADPIKEGKSEEEVLYEVLLKYGVFDQEVKKLKINNKDIYSISDNYLVIMLSNKIEDKDIEEIKKLKPKVVIFRDSGFNGNDTVKINAFYNLTKSGAEEVKTV
jgi:adenine-specific DNA-methyltransferase